VDGSGLRRTGGMSLADWVAVGAFSATGSGTRAASSSGSGAVSVVRGSGAAGGRLAAWLSVALGFELRPATRGLGVRSGQGRGWVCSGAVLGRIRRAL
jgi:hypothetical protein